MQEIDTKAWKKEDFLREANIQSAHIARLSTYRRWALSLAAIFVIVLMWQKDALGLGAEIALGACAVLFGVVGAVIGAGVSAAKKNVEALLRAAGVDPDELLKKKSGKERKE